MSYIPTIGLEVHAELATKSKMFCGCKNDPFSAEPNTHICPICTGHPGTLPVPNKQAIEMVLLFGRAIGANTATYSEFDRKNYFYPDLPKAYQISQYAFPFVSGGFLEGVEITRVHLEEDTARSQHDKGSGSLVDFNRSSVPLMELVTEPVIHDARTALRFARELQLLLRTLGISGANMEKGEMRVEANISVSKDETKFGTKVEVKNLNSFKAVEGAILYEIERQIQILESGNVVKQETRGWNENTLTTFSQRSKETAKDYRYFPDPDIPKLDIAQVVEWSEARLAEKTPILPSKKRVLYRNLGLTDNVIEVLVSSQKLDRFAEEFFFAPDLDKEIALLAANYLVSDVMALIEGGCNLEDLQTVHFKELMTLLVSGEIGSRVAKDLLTELFASKVGPRELAKERGLLQISDMDVLQPFVIAVVADNPAVVEEYRSGKIQASQFLLGQIMKKTKGAANPEVLRDLLEKTLK